jgi:hypothetical protein
MNIHSLLKKNKVDIDWQQFFHLAILDKLGKTIFESNSPSPNKILKINPGLYHLEINHDKGTYQQKIIV